MEPGVQTPDETLEPGDRLVPRQRLVARAGPAPRSASPPGSCRATSCSYAPTEAALDGPDGPDGRLHRSARVGRGVHPRRRLDRARPDLGPVRRRRAHPARLHAPSVDRGAGLRVDRPGRGHVRVRQRRPPDPRRPSGHPAVLGRAVGTRSIASGHQVDERARRRRRPPDDGWRADVRLDRRHGRRRVEQRRRRRRPSASSREATRRPARRPIRGRGRCCTTARASGIPASRCRAGRSRVIWRTDGAAAVAGPFPARRHRRTPGRRPTQQAVAVIDRHRPPIRARCRPACSPRTRTRSTARGPRPASRPATRRPRRRPPPTRGSPRRRRSGRRRSPRSTPRADAADRLGRSRCIRPSTTDGRTTTWTLRRGRLVLAPRRLADRTAAAARLAHVVASSRPTVERSPFERSHELPPPGDAAAPAPRSWRRRTRRRRLRSPSRPATATCCVFLPPVEHARTRVELLRWSRRPPPSRLSGRRRGLRATPRPAAAYARGHPRSRVSSRSTCSRRVRGPSWSTSSTRLYDEARLTRLGTEKFALDGAAHRHRRRQPPDPRRRDPGRQPVPAAARPAAQHAHVLAAPPVAVVPVLRPVHRSDEPGTAGRRRPPREPLRTRDRIRRTRATRATTSPPWLVDRVLRHLLVDLTGNTHRAEFCIDKLFSPDSDGAGSGCSNCAASRCRRTADGARPDPAGPIARRPVLGGAVHRPARPLGHRSPRPVHAAVVRAPDIADVVDDLDRHGIAFDPVWLEPFLEFRFPLIGEVTVGRRAARAAQRDRAVARARRGGDGDGHGPLRRLVGRATAGAGRGVQPTNATS